MGRQGVTKEKRQEYNRRYRIKHPEKRDESVKRFNKKIRKLVIDAYGGKCSCCGETEPLFLTLEHTWKDGAEHRRQTKGHVYAWCKRNNFPKDRGLDVLCWNCQWPSRMSVPCPHKVNNETNRRTTQGATALA